MSARCPTCGSGPEDASRRADLDRLVLVLLRSIRAVDGQIRIEVLDPTDKVRLWDVVSRTQPGPAEDLARTFTGNERKEEDHDEDQDGQADPPS